MKKVERQPCINPNMGICMYKKKKKEPTNLEIRKHKSVRPDSLGLDFKEWEMMRPDWSEARVSSVRCWGGGSSNELSKGLSPVFKKSPASQPEGSFSVASTTNMAKLQSLLLKIA